MSDINSFLEKAGRVVPTERQLRHLKETPFYAFVHFSPNTYTGLEWGDGTEDPAIFNPTELDCEQWAKAIKDAGMKGMVLTAISDEGHVAFVYPFADVLNEINGKHPVMRKVELTAADIKLDGETSTVDAILKAVRQNQIDESKMLKDISDTLSKLTAKVAKLEATLVDFTNNQ